MSRPLPKITLLLRSGALGLAVLAVAVAPANAAVRPLSARQYTVLPKCSAPEPGHAGCFAVGLVRRADASSRTAPSATLSPRNGEVGYRPSDLHTAYNLPTTASKVQTIALVDAFNDPTAEADLRTYDEEFKLPECTKASGCFSQVSQNAAKPLPFPKTTLELEEARAKGEARAEEAIEWGGEISLDIETAHAICQNCHILLVEAKSTGFADLEEAETRAETLGANEISNSWGGEEGAGVASQEPHGPFDHPKTVITASAGDDGYLGWYAVLEGLAERLDEGADFPASSPHVVAVGGTRLELGTGSKWAHEQVWNGNGAGGGGCSAHLAAPGWQTSLADWQEIGCGTQRSVSDISADADPYTGVAVRYTGGECSFETEKGSIEGWCPIGGTSLASPLIAAAFALAGGSHEVEYPAQTLYEGARDVPGAVHDVTEGSNGICETFDGPTGLSSCSATAEAEASCPTKPGSCMACPRYDGPTGVGTPDGLEAFGPTTPVAEAPYDPASCKLEEAHTAVTTTSAPPPAPPQTPTATTETTTTRTAAPTPAVTALALTPWSALALNRGHATSSKVGFAFVLNAATRVRVTLARRVGSHGRFHWVTAARAMTLDALAGRNAKRLSGRSRLLAGLYRLTLTPTDGKPRSIVFRVR